MSKSIKLEPRSLGWARQIVSFAVSNDSAYPQLNSIQIEASRVVATDGTRLAWQEYESATPCSAMVPGFPEYEKVIHRAPARVSFPMILDKDWLDALKRISKLNRIPYGYLVCDGMRVEAWLENAHPHFQAKILLPTEEPAQGKPYPSFKIGVRLDYLYEALNAANQGGIPVMSVRDEKTVIEIKNECGFFSITMPCSVDGAFMAEPEAASQAA